MQSISKWPFLATWIFFARCIFSASATYHSTANLTEIPAIRTYFYIRGEYVTDTTGGHFLRGQIYVEKLVPLGGARRKEPLVFIHGNAQTGTNWLNTPDGRRGWASYFLQNGYVVYIVDQPQRGRSPYRPGEGSLATYSAEYISSRFTAVEKFNLWPQARLHTQWPGSGQRGDSVFDAYYASQVQFQNDSIIVQTNGQRAGAALLDLIGPSILITHSQAGTLGFLIADARPTLVRALISLEPQGPPFLDRVFTTSTTITRPYGLSAIPITYDPPITNIAATDSLITVTVASAGSGLSECLLQASSPPRKLSNLATVPMLVVEGEASYHAVYDYCTVSYLRQAGVRVDFLKLAEAGIHGNAHLFFLEKNNLAIAATVQRWLRNVDSS